MRYRAILLVLSLAACTPRHAAVDPGPAAALQAFYDAYLPQFAQGRSRAFLDDSTTLVSPILRQALIADYEASAADSTQVVGLDFDPFLNSQDPCPVYRVGADAPAGTRHLLQVQAVCPADTTVAAIAVLEPAAAGWSLVDLQYPADSTSLLGILARLAHERSGAPATD